MEKTCESCKKMYPARVERDRLARDNKRNAPEFLTRDACRVCGRDVRREDHKEA